ncbi:hypothetical protein GBA52_015190 [Prunus armeniaca]|nr:hypothetical protein GBA52_015190 [Prunus armeniaca]
MKTLNRENHFACSFVFDYYYTNQNYEDYNLDMLKLLMERAHNRSREWRQSMSSSQRRHYLACRRAVAQRKRPTMNNVRDCHTQGGPSNIEERHPGISCINSNIAEILINVDHEEPSWWVWVTEDMISGQS